MQHAERAIPQPISHQAKLETSITNANMKIGYYVIREPILYMVEFGNGNLIKIKICRTLDYTCN